MEIKNHRLVGVDYRPSPNTSGNIREHKYLIVHDDVGASMEGTSSWIMNKVSKVSYHILVGREGQVIQFVDLNKRAWHCGQSHWKGLNDLNWYTIGICMQNTGNQVYTEAQIKKAIEISKVLVKHYNLTEAIGHKQIAPKRKVDPNNSFPWDRFRKEIFSKDDTNTVITKKVTASGLNLREGAGTNFKSINVLTNGTEVSIISESNGWSEVFVCSSQQYGYVSSTHIK